MSVQHFKSLLFKSAQIQEQIDQEHKRRSPDWLRLLKLKKLRLLMKDKMQRLAIKAREEKIKMTEKAKKRVPRTLELKSYDKKRGARAYATVNVTHNR